MTKSLLRLLLPAVLVMGSFAMAAPAAAYVAPTVINTCQASDTNVAGGQTFDLTCLFAPNTSVTFSLKSGPDSCTATFSPSSGVTDQQGVINTRVTLQANCPGAYLLAATANGVTATVTVNEVGGFPNTSTSRPFIPALPAWGAIGAGLLLVLLSGGVLLRRRS